MEQTASVVFTIEELWYLQSVVRHEMAQQDTWRYPPANIDLNDQIAETILRCTEEGLHEAPLLLTRGDCLLLDAVVSQGAKTPMGKPMGVPILLKTFAARRVLAGGPVATAEEPAMDETEREQLIDMAQRRYEREI